MCGLGSGCGSCAGGLRLGCAVEQSGPYVWVAGWLVIACRGRGVGAGLENQIVFGGLFLFIFFTTNENLDDRDTAHRIMFGRLLGVCDYC